MVLELTNREEVSQPVMLLLVAVYSLLSMQDLSSLGPVIYQHHLDGDWSSLGPVSLPFVLLLYSLTSWTSC